MKERLMQSPVFEMAVQQFDRVADFLAIDSEIRERCKWPKRLITVTMPERLDDGRIEVFFGHLVRHAGDHGGVAGFPGGEGIDPEEMLLQECDELVPAALERAITRHNVGKLRCRVLAEGANGPTTPEADAILDERGDVFILPDVLCNAGGVTVSYFEWVQNLQRMNWGEQEVLTKLETQLEGAFERLLFFARREGVSHRTAALALGICEVAEVKKKRGLFP